jgi:hypothetical protein
MEIYNRFQEVVNFFGYSKNGDVRNSYIYIENDRYTTIKWDFDIEIFTVFDENSNVKIEDFDSFTPLRSQYDSKTNNLIFIKYNCTSIDNLLKYLYNLHPGKARLEKLKRILWE